MSIQDSGKKKGYKDLFQSKAYPSDFLRPHRKELMSSIFRNNNQPSEIGPSLPIFQGQKNRLLNSEASNNNTLTNSSIVPPKDLARIKKPHQHKNQLAAAIDHALNTESHYLIRAPIKVPPNYKAKLEELHDIGSVLTSRHVILDSIQSEQEKARVKLRFEKEFVDSIVEKEQVVEPADPFKPKGLEITFEDTPKSNTKSKTNGARKTSLQSHSDSITESVASSSPLGSKGENWQSRNVPYMLKIWEKAEGVSLVKLLHPCQLQKYHLEELNDKKITRQFHDNNSNSSSPLYPEEGELKAEETHLQKNGFPSPDSLNPAHSTRNLLDPLKQSTILLSPSRSRSSSVSFSHPNSSRFGSAKSAQSHQSSHLALSPQASSRIDSANSSLNTQKIPPPETSKTLSKSTFNLLKRMSRDNPSDPLHDPPTEHAIVSKILSGIDPVTMKKENMETFSFEKDSKPVVIKFESPFRNMTPGTRFKEIGKFISDSGDLINPERGEGESSNKTPFPQDVDFELYIPPFVAEDDSVMTNTTRSTTRSTPDRPRTAKEIERGVNPRTLIGEKLRAVFGRKIVVPQSKNNVAETFKPVYLKARIPPKQEELETAPLKNFSVILKSVLQSESHNFFTPEEKEVGISFIDSPASRLPSLPMEGSKDHDQILKCVLICLRKDQIRALHFESVKLLILLDGDAGLGRWDAMIFKQGMKDILDFGTEEQKQIVAYHYVEIGMVDEKVIGLIRLALGDLVESKRLKAISILSNIDIQFAEYVTSIISQDSAHSNWRIRYDLVALIEAWIPRLAPPEPSPPMARDKDALDTDDEKTVKALFHTFGSSAPEGATEGVDGVNDEYPGFSTDEVTAPNPDKKSVSIDVVNSIHFSNNDPKLEKLYDTCVDVLLNLMTSDWSVDVRCAASDVVGSLQLGKSLFRWIISSLKSPDPVIRVDGLRCLSCIGAIHEDSLQAFVQAFKDPYASVRIEACKVALNLASSNRHIISSLMDLLDDHDCKVRAYAIRAIGSTKFKVAKVRECLNWALQHDSSHIVRIEALGAVFNMGMIQEDQLIRDGVLTLLSSDKSDRVRKEAERVLVLAGIIFPKIGDEGGKTEGTRQTIDGQIVSPYPHILGDKAKEEIEIYLRNSLIGEREMSDVIEKVKSLSNKETVMHQVDEMGQIDATVNRLDLKYDSTFAPQVSEIRAKKKDPFKNIVVRDAKGIPILKTQILPRK